MQNALKFQVQASWQGERGSVARTERGSVTLDTTMQGAAAGLNPVETLLAALAACMFKGTERVRESLALDFTSMEIDLQAVRPATEARIESITYQVRIATNADDRKLELLHENLKKHGTIYNTVRQGTNISGTIVRELNQAMV